MKLVRLLTRLAIFFSTAFAAKAGQSGDFTYEVNQSSVTITGYTGKGGDVSIPDNIAGMPVTIIGKSAFAGCIGLTSVTVPDTVNTIGDWAFSECIELSNTDLGNSVISLGNGAFFGCIGLINIRLPEGLIAVGSEAFEGCTWLISINLPESLIYLRESAFKECSSLINITFPSNLISVGDYAFISCSGLTNLTIPNSVTTIGLNAFEYCTGLTNVYIGSGATNIDIGVFDACYNLENINVNIQNPTCSDIDGVLFNKEQTSLIQCPYAKVAGVEIPNTVIYIGMDAFNGCNCLKSVTLPKSVKILYWRAFANCAQLTSIYCEGNAPMLEDNSVFKGSDNLTVYYRDNSIGWHPTYGGRPTAIWAPQSVISNNSVVISRNIFGFNFIDSGDSSIVVEACADIATPIWSPVGTNKLTGGAAFFSDPQWTNYPRRFYRLRMP